MEKIKVNLEQCEKAANILKDYHFRNSFYDREFLTATVDHETKFRAYLFASSICHQTHTLQSKNLNLKGWDYLEYIFLDLMENDDEFFNPQNLAFTTRNDLIQKMKMIFSDDGNPIRCTLDRLPERAEILIRTARMIQEKYENKVQSLVDLSQCYLINNGKGLYELLEKFTAFRDPLRKKSTLFIKLMEDAKLIMVKDSENFIPPMDYQVQRVLLRLGLVEIMDQEMRKKLQIRKKIDSDKEIREKCIEAIRVISEVSEYRLARLSDLFWALGRSCCNEKMLCQGKICSRNPCTLAGLINLGKHANCVFDSICLGRADEEYRKYWQPVVKTHYY